MFTNMTFEHPLNERVRTFLRLEYLLDKVAYFLPQEDLWTSRVTVEGLLDILAITARTDIKTELLKELDRNSGALNRVQRGLEEDSSETLGETLDDLRQATSGLYELTGPIGQALRQDDFLKGIAKRSSIPGGTCSFDLSQYHYWLQQPPELRQRQLHTWIESLQPMNDAITLALSLIRTSAAPREVTAVGGFFQETLNPQTPAQLLRVTLDDNDHLFPEISGHKTRFSIRFIDMGETGQPLPWREDTTFTLTCCVF